MREEPSFIFSQTTFPKNSQSRYFIYLCILYIIYKQFKDMPVNKKEIWCTWENRLGIHNYNKIKQNKISIKATIFLFS